jgi:low affinity Fe/Cu permease
MAAYYVVSIAAVVGLFALFLVIGKTLNSAINYLAKIEYLLTSALEYRRERIAIQHLLEEEVKDLSEGEEKKK